MEFLKWIWVNPWNNVFIQAVYTTAVTEAAICAFCYDLPTWISVVLTIASYGTFNGFLMLVQGEGE